MKKTVRQILSIAMALCLLLSLTPAAFADETTVEDAEALKTALLSGGSIKLDADIDVSEALVISKNTTLDLNGKTLSVNHSGRENYAVLVSAALTILDSGSGGKLTSATSNTLFLDYSEGAAENSLTLLGGTVENTCRKWGDTAIVAVGTNISTVTISGGTVRSDDGSAIFAQAKTTISGGFFRGEVYLSMQEYKGDPDHQAITGGYFDSDPDGVYDFYGKAYEVVQDTQYPGYPYKVQPIPAGDLVTVSYELPSGLVKASDHFRKGTMIDMPDAPHYPSHRFIAWSVSGSPIIFPYQVQSNAAFTAVYVYVSPIPEGFFPEGKPLKNLYVGGIPMMENGVAAGTLPYQIAGDTGTAALGYDETYGVYTLTLDTYANTDVYTGTLDANAYNFGVYAEGNLAVILQENSKITATDAGAAGAIGVAVTQGSLAIVSMDSGRKELTVESRGQAENGMNIGVYADGDLAVWKCELDASATGGKSAGGVLAMNNSQAKTANIYVVGSYVTASASASYYGVGFGASGDVALQDDSVVHAHSAGGTYSYGAQCGDLSLDDDSLLGVYSGSGIEGEACRSSYGITAEKIDLVDGMLYAYAGKATGESYAVEAYGAITVSPDGEIYAESEGSTDGDSSSYGVWSMDDITVEGGGALYGVSGGMNDGESYGVYAWGDMTVQPGGLILGIGGDAQDEASQGGSTGVQAEKITVEDGGSLWCFGGETAAGDSYGVYAGEIAASGAGVEIDEYDFELVEEYLVYGAVYARSGKALKGDSYGLCVENGMDVSADGTVYAYGGKAPQGESYGLYSEGNVVMDGDSQVQCSGGDAEDFSAGAYLESYSNQGVLLHISNGSRLEAAGGNAVYESIGLDIENGCLQMDGEDGTAILRLDADGGIVTEGNSIGIYVCPPEEAQNAISLSDGAEVYAAGSKANDDGEGNSIGVCAEGDIALDGAEMYATGAADSDFAIGVFLYGEDLSLTLTGKAKACANAYESANGSAGVYFDDMEAPGTVSVAEGCVLSAYADEAELSVAIGNVGTLTTGGTITAIAEGENGSGILMNDLSGVVPAINVAKGQLGASGQTVAIGAVSGPDSPIGNVTLTAPYIEYSENPDGSDTRQVKGKPAELTANETQKHILALASGEISALSLSGIDTALSYGAIVRFSAKAAPQSVVKVEEERWIRISDGKVISSKRPSAPGAGTYRYELVLVPEEGFTFAAEGDGVAVVYNDDEYFEFYPQEDGKLILSNETAGEVFIPDVTVEAPYYPPVDPGTGNPSGSTKLVKVELPAQAGQVPVIVKADGSEEIVTLSYTENGTACALVPEGATVKMVDDEPMEFGDVKASDWFAGAVGFVTGRGIFLGTDRGFEPGKTMSRAMLATVLMRISGEKAPVGGTRFGDVPANAWFAEAAMWAGAAGVVTGTDKGFEPDAPVTREQIATMLYRFMKHLKLDVSVSGSASLAGFPDGGQTSAWAQEAMSWAVSAGLFRGDETGALNPGSSATRAEVATLVQRLVKLIVG